MNICVQITEISPKNTNIKKVGYVVGQITQSDNIDLINV